MAVFIEFREATEPSRREIQWKPRWRRAGQRHSSIRVTHSPRLRHRHISLSKDVRGFWSSYDLNIISLSAVLFEASV